MILIMRTYYTVLFLFALLMLAGCAQQGNDVNEGATRKGRAFTFVQLCDPQLGMTRYSEDSLRLVAAVEQINKLKPRFVLFCGDLVHHASPRSLSDFKAVAEGLEVNYYCVPGNHDLDKDSLEGSIHLYDSIIGRRSFYLLKAEGHVFMMCNTMLWRGDYGFLSEEHDVWFDQKIEMEKDKPIFIVGHHPLYRDSLNEPLSYKNISPAARERVLGHMEGKNIVAYLHGHLHMHKEEDVIGLWMYGGASSCINFDENPPGFSLWTLTDDGWDVEYVPLDSLPAREDD